jgi:hypothetical protein
MHHELLASRYLDVLKDLDISYLDRQHPDAKSKPVPREGKPGLSGLFLPSVPQHIGRAKHRIMVIGSETAQWNVLTKDEPFPSLPAYIEKALAKHQKFFNERLLDKNSSGSTFHNFMRSVAGQCGSEGLIYSNLFCFDWNRGSPMRSKDYFPTVEKYSELLIKAQIEVLKPEIIIFANGITSVRSRRKFFPISGEHVACTKGHDYEHIGSDHTSPQIIRKHHLWGFTLYDKIRCFRIHHPSAQSKEAAQARKFLLTLLPTK